MPRYVLRVSEAFVKAVPTYLVAKKIGGRDGIVRTHYVRRENLMKPDAYTRKLYADQPTVVPDERVGETSKFIFGRELEAREWGALVGAVVGSTVVVQGYGDSAYIVVKHPQYTQERSVYGYSQGVITLDNEHFARLDLGDPNHPRGLGTRIVAHQVRAAQRLGIREITCEASGSFESEKKGYYAWPRVGFEGNLTPEHRALFSQHTDAAAPATVLELLTLKGGKEWWLRHGTSISVKFDLTAGSLSDRVMVNYLKEKGIWLK